MLQDKRLTSAGDVAEIISFRADSLYRAGDPVSIHASHGDGDAQAAAGSRAPAGGNVDTATDTGGAGTVFARYDATAMTVCWGLCGGESEGEFGCGGGSEECTRDPFNDLCYSYAQQCPFTVIPSWSCGGTCGADAGETVCAGNCTEQCTV